MEYYYKTIIRQHRFHHAQMGNSEILKNNSEIFVELRKNHQAQITLDSYIYMRT